MKPGRPTLFARKNSSFYFGLPGNPISTIVGFHFFDYATRSKITKYSI